MEPKFEPKQYTPEEIAHLEKSRTISDAELLKGGAEYVVGENGEKENLLLPREDTNSGKYMGEETEPESERKQSLYENIQRQEFKSGDKVKVKLMVPGEEEISVSVRGGIHLSAKEVESLELYLVGEPIHGDVLQVTTIPPTEWPPAEGITRNRWGGKYFDIDLSDLRDVKKVEN